MSRGSCALLRAGDQCGHARPQHFSGMFQLWIFVLCGSVSRVFSCMRPLASLSAKRRLNHCYAQVYTQTNSVKKLLLLRSATAEAVADPERRCTWERNLHRADKPPTADCAVCELLYEQCLIIRDCVYRLNGKFAFHAGHLRLLQTRSPHNSAKSASLPKQAVHFQEE